MGGYPCPYGDGGTCIPAESEANRLVVIRDGAISLVTGDLVDRLAGGVAEHFDAELVKSTWLKDIVRRFTAEFLDPDEKISSPPEPEGEGNWLYVPCQPCGHWSKVPHG